MKKYLVSAAATITASLLIQAGSLIWWASSINQRVAFLENNMAAVQKLMYEMNRALPTGP